MFGAFEGLRFRFTQVVSYISLPLLSFYTGKSEKDKS